MLSRVLRASAVAALAALATPGRAEPLLVPFDFSRSAIGLDVMIDGTPLYMILDTGVDPSVIDLARADALGLKVDREEGGEASGEGNAAKVPAHSTTITRLAIGGRAFAPVEALAMDTGTLSANYGRQLDGVLGYSFLKDKIALIDYSAHNVKFLGRAEDAKASVGMCRKRWSIALRSFEGNSIPIVPVHFGEAIAPISLDTGSNGGIALYQGALDLPGVRAALVEQGVASYAGPRGNATAKSYRLETPVRFGPFTLPAGQIVTVRSVKGSADTRLANVGNKPFAALRLKLLLDYRARRLTFYGDCDPQVRHDERARPR